MARSEAVGNRWIEFPADGKSMGSRWRKARRLLCERVPPAGFGWSDVVVCEIGGVMIAHRIVARMQRQDGLYLITKGDGYWMPDRIAVPENRIVAVVRAMDVEGTLVAVDRGWHVILGWLHAVWGRAMLPWCRPLGSSGGR